MNLRFLAASLLFASAAAAGCTDSADVDTADGPDNSLSEHALSSAEHTAYNYFVSKGLTPAQSAGIVGNLIQESSVSPTVSEYGGGPGRGIAQWSTGGRWDHSTHDNVTWYANQHGVSRWALSTQLDFIWYELTTFSGYGLSSLKSSTTVSGATVAFMKYYEVCGTCAQGARVSDAQTIYNAYAGTSGGGGGGDADPDRYGRRVLLRHEGHEHAREQLRREQVRQPLVPVLRRQLGRPLVGPGRLRGRVPALTATATLPAA